MAFDRTTATPKVSGPWQDRDHLSASLVERARTEREIGTAFENMVQRRAAAKSVARELDRLFDRALLGSSGSGGQDGTGIHRAAHERNGQSPKLTRPGTILVREWQGTTHHVTV